MTTVEKLLLQIFERNRLILEQVKKQTELFDQHLASKCLLDGISPPPWLLSPSFSSLSLHPNGLKKEELISGLLLPRSQPPSFYPSAHHPHSDVNKVNDSVVRLSVLSQFPTTDTPCAFNHARDSQNPDNGADHSRSLGRIERSKSRQRALEIRSSVRSAKLHANDENDPDSCQNDGNFTKGELKRTHSWRKEGSGDHDNVRTQSGGPCQPSSPINELLNKNKSPDIVKKDVIRESTRKSVQQSNYADRISEAANLTVAADEICATEEVNGGDCIINEVDSVIHSGGATSSRHSSLQNDAVKEASDKVRSIHNGAKSVRFGHSTERSYEQANNDNRLQEFVKPSSATFNRTHECLNLQITDIGSIEMGSKDDFVKVTRSMSSNRCRHSDEGVQLDYTLSNMKEDGCNSNRVPYHVDVLRDSNKPMVEVPDLQSMEIRGDIVGIPKPTQSISPNLQNDDVDELREMSVSSNMAEDADTAVAESNRLSLLLLSSNVVGQEVSYAEQVGTHSNGLASAVSTTIFDLEKCGTHPAETGIYSAGLVVADSVTSRSNSGGHNVGVTSRSESENAMLMEPKQLDFEDMEVNRTSNSNIQDENGILSNKQSPAKRHSAFLSTEVTSVGLREKDSLLPNMPSLNDLNSQEKPRKDSSQDLGKDTVDNASDMNSVLEQTSIMFAQNPYFCSSFMDSWPQFKRIKVGDRPSYPGSTASSLTTMRVQPLPQYNEAISSNDSNRAVEEMLQDSDNNTIQAFEVLSSNLPFIEDEPTLGERDVSEKTAHTFLHEHLEANSLSSLTKLSIGSSEGYLSGQAKVRDLTETAEVQISYESQVSSPQVSDSFYQGRLVTENNMQMKNSYFGGDHSPADYHPVAATLSVDSIIVPDENVPELENFFVETNDTEFSAAKNRTSFTTLVPPKTNLGHASLLEQLCKSNFSDPYGLQHNTLDPDHQLMSTSVLGMLDMKGNLVEDGDSNKLFEATTSFYCLNDEVSSFTSHETYMFPTENAHFIQRSSKAYVSPVRKFWEHMPLKSLSSERRASSIPDLPSIDEEETENMYDDVINISPQNAMNTVYRKPLADITVSANPLASPCEEGEVIDDRNSIASVCTEFSVATSTCNLKTGNQTKSRSRYGYAASNKEKSQQHQQPRVRFGAKRNDGSLQNRLFSKPPKLSRKNEFRKVSSGLLEKEPKHNNIVSNVTSFVQLVQQQKQTASAAVIAGKRDIKVKALEAAEAAKRVAEKKENDRRLKKEALKLERARIEEQNLRQVELEKGRKEEEQKKKVAEMAAKKRQREEEQKKDRERKRKRIEDTRKQNMEQRDKMNRGNKEETKCGGEALDVEANKLKEKSGEEERMEKATGTKNPSIGHAAYDTRSRNPDDNSMDVIENQISEGKGKHCSLDSNIIIPERSYEISPYKGSDDEDEESEDDDDGDKPNTKFIPAWSRKSGITLTILSQQAKIEASTIFPLESFISKDQVVLPRKLRHL